MDLEDTIVAVSSPAGPGERAILRLSGPRAMAIAESVFAAADAAPLSAERSYTARAGRLEFPASRLTVPALAYLMRAPRSYTRQDVVEFHVGAWPAIEGDLVAGLVAAGARPAEPGEFTFRALMSGRLDLAQAEAVMAVVAASSAAALRAAGDLLGGHLSREIAALADQVRGILALVEVGLDFSDQDIEIISHDELASRLSLVRAALADLGRRSRGLETFSGHVRLVLAGRPNAGKSSLFNRLLEADRAIVSPEAGTTRDEVRAALHVGGLTLDLSDIAGLDPMEGVRSLKGAGLLTPSYADNLAAKAQAKALEALGRADLVLLVLDATAPSYEGTDELLALVAAPLVVAVTKCDLAPADRAMDHLAARGVRAEAVATSAVTGQGIEALRAALVRTVEGGAVDRQAAGPVVTARHRAAMEQAAGALARASRLARRGEADELVALELHEALDALGAILGRRVDGDVLAEIFSQFCIGK
jgi:tRNA modification GTPase